MSNALNRRGFLALIPGGMALATGYAVTARAAGDPYKPSAKLHAEFPSQEPALVREVVAASHTRLERVRELVSASPALAKAAWDWGFGDWESALGAASHMGRRDIAELLMGHGARPNLYTHTMLGRLFERETDPIAIIQWKEMYDNLESTIDDCADVANDLESIVLKNA